MTGWTAGLLGAATALALVVVALVVWLLAMGQAAGGGALAPPTAEAPVTGAVGRSGGAARPPDRYEWVDRDRGLVRIPIDRAMEVVVERAREEGVR